MFGCEKGDSYRHVKAVYLNLPNPQLTNHPNRWLGRWFDSTLSDKGCLGLCQQVGEGWEGLTIQNSPQHWRPGCSSMTSLSDYLFGNLCSMPCHSCEARTTHKQTPEKMDRHVTQGIPQDWTIHSTNSQMPISLLVELHKVAKERLLLTLQMKDRWCRRHTSQYRNGLWCKQRTKPNIISSANKC